MNDPDWLANFLRIIFTSLDAIGYKLVSAVYNIFFTVANAQLFSGDMIKIFFSRIQLILGVLMTFKLALTALNIIINPDSFKDKEKGAGKLIMRIVMALVMLTLVVPIAVPEEALEGNPLNQQINDNGILFGFLYQFQNAIMKENILGKLILGSNADSTEDGNLDNLSDIGGALATTVARTFITPTLLSTDEDPVIDSDSGKLANTDVACEEAIEAYDYNNSNLSYKVLISNINKTCKSDKGEVYVFNYTLLLGLICSIIMTLIILGFTVDVAVRSIKLSLLRLISPVPIISYITPGSEKNGAFGNWVKSLTSTYIDLFLRIAVIYFGAYIIVLISNGEINIWQNSTGGFFTSLFATVFVIIGVLIFMKDAPKFIKDMLGIKGDGKLFSGIGTMLGAAALTGGLVGSTVSAAKTGYSEGQEMGHGKFRSALRGASAGAGGLLGGAYLGGKALANADKKQFSTVRASMQKGITRRAAGSTLGGRVKEGAYSMLTGSTTADRYDSQIQAYNDFSDLYSAFDTKADADSTWIDANTGQSVKQLKEYYDLLRDSDASTADIEAARDNWKNAKGALQDAVISGAYSSSPIAKQMKRDYDNAQKLVAGAGLEVGSIADSKNFKIASFNAKDQARNLKQEHKYKASKANRDYSK